MSKINVPLVEVMVRRDAHTITPVAVPPYELTMLRQMFGRENVSGDTVVAHMEVDVEQEHERLSAKYGPQKVVKVYGDDGGERLKEMVEKAAAKPEPAAKKGKADDTRPE
jgi:hypothetical protein